MSGLAETRARIASMGELLDIVGAMRSLAAIRMQEALGRLDGIRLYADAMAAAIADAALLLPDGHGGAPGPRALVICAAEHGFVGGFNERLVGAALAQLAPHDTLVILGTRGALLAEEKGRPADFNLPMATRCDGVPDMVNRLSAEFYRRIAGGKLGAIAVMFARYRPGAAATIETRRLLPLDEAILNRPRRAAQPPLHNLPPAVLHERLVAEHVFALLTEAAVESLASENAARFTAMDSARDNVGKQLDELQRRAREARQTEITTELIELVTGAEALAGGGTGVRL